MTIDQLEAFITIVNEGGIRAASKILHKTQPTLSMGIKNLEEELGINLLNRDSYRVTLSEQGQIIYEKAIEIINKTNELKLRVNELKMGREPRLRLAIDYLCPMSFLLNTLSTFSQKLELTKIEMDFEILNEAENKLINNKVDLAITPFLGQHSQIEFVKICDIRILPVISTKIFQKTNPPQSEFLKIPQLIVKNNKTKSNDSISFGQNKDSPHWIISDHLIKKELIINGFGWGHLEESSIQNELNEKSLIELNTKGIKRKKMPLYLVRSSERPFGPSSKELWNFICSQFRN